MQTLKNTVAENLGGKISRPLAPESGKFSLEQDPSLDEKVAVVTGGSENIRYGYTRTFSHNISSLFILSKSEDVISDALSTIRSEMGDTAAKVEWMQCDLSGRTGAENFAFDIADKTDKLDILINNAARSIMTQQLAKGEVDLHMAQNHMGHVVLISHLLPLLKKTASRKYCPNRKPRFERPRKCFQRHQIRVH